jgi:membrane associated rhomboid family serine protease
MFPLKDNIPLGRLPLVTIALIVVNVVAYLIEIRHGGSFWSGPSENVAVHYGAIPYELTHPGDHCDLAHSLGGEALHGTVLCQGRTPGIAGGAEGQPATWMTIFTSMFLHGSFLHIFGNMLFLAIFGPTVEDRIGRGRYLAFYLIGGLIALAAQTAVDADSTAPMLGASGAIAAVLGGYILLFPRARILALVVIIFFVTIIEIPALVMLGLWFAEQLWLGLAGLAEPLGGAGVAYFAHIGGFAFGLASIRLFAPGISPGYGRKLGR